MTTQELRSYNEKVATTETTERSLTRLALNQQQRQDLNFATNTLLVHILSYLGQQGH